MERFDTLMVDYLDAGLPLQAQEELAALVHENASLRQRFIAQTEMTGLLSACCLPQSKEDDLIRRTMRCLPHTDQSIEQIMARIAVIAQKAGDARSFMGRSPIFSWRFWIATAAMAIFSAGMLTEALSILNLSVRLKRVQNSHLSPYRQTSMDSNQQL